MCCPPTVTIYFLGQLSIKTDLVKYEKERMKDLHGSEPKKGSREKAEKKMKIGSPIKTEVDCINLD